MPLNRYAFIIRAPGYEGCIHKTRLVSPEFATTIVGVRNLLQAVEAANEVIDAGVQLIELCGGFTSEEARELHSKTGRRVPIGVVRYSGEEEKELATLLTE